MFTIQYKAWFINGYIDRSECTVVLPKGGLWGKAKSLLAAKRMITRDSQWVKDSSC